MKTSELLERVKEEVHDVGHARIRSDLGELPVAAHTPPDNSRDFLVRLIARKPITDQLALTESTGDSLRLFHSLPDDESIIVVEEGGLRYAVHRETSERTCLPRGYDSGTIALEALVQGYEARVGLLIDGTAVAA